MRIREIFKPIPQYRIPILLRRPMKQIDRPMCLALYAKPLLLLIGMGSDNKLMHISMEFRYPIPPSQRHQVQPVGGHNVFHELVPHPPVLPCSLVHRIKQGFYVCLVPAPLQQQPQIREPPKILPQQPQILVLIIHLGLLVSEKPGLPPHLPVVEEERGEGLEHVQGPAA